MNKSRMRSGEVFFGMHHPDRPHYERMIPLDILHKQEAEMEWENVIRFLRERVEGQHNRYKSLVACRTEQLRCVFGKPSTTAPSVGFFQPIKEACDKIRSYIRG
jgi:hypothetical protein